MVRFQRVCRRRRGRQFRGRRADRRQSDRRPAPHADRRPAPRSCAPRRASGHPTEDANRAFIEPDAAELSVRLRAHRAALRQPVRARPRRQPEVLRLRPAARPARRARRRPVARAARLRRPGHPAGPLRRRRRATSTSRRPSATSWASRSIDGTDWSGRTRERARRRARRLPAAPGRPRARRDPRPRATRRARARLPRHLRRPQQQRAARPARHATTRSSPTCAACSTRSARFRYGSTVNFPSITWPSHSAHLHRRLVRPPRHRQPDVLRRAPRASRWRRRARAMMTESFLGAGVETLYEAFHRVLGADARSPPTSTSRRAAAPTTPPLERRVVGPRDRLKALTAELRRRHQSALRAPTATRACTARRCSTRAAWRR